jgi:uncharacterized membrane protein YccC
MDVLIGCALVIAGLSVLGSLWRATHPRRLLKPR